MNIITLETKTNFWLQIDYVVKINNVEVFYTNRYDKALEFIEEMAKSYMLYLQTGCTKITIGK